MKRDDLYGEAFQTSLGPGSARSARTIVPLVVDLLQPGSVVDVGCGVGAWLLAFKRAGIGRILGVDHDGGHISRVIEEQEFLPHDLTRPLPTIEPGFDLAMSLEVAEHLPETNADAFVAQLTGLAPAVLFSAAVPHQGGTGHVNEQWPEYWARRFVDNGFVPVDCIRPVIWNDAEVEFWYAQNLILYVHPSLVAPNDALKAAAAATRPDTLSRVHPALYLAKCKRSSLSSLAGSGLSTIGSGARSTGRMIRSLRGLRTSPDHRAP